MAIVNEYNFFLDSKYRTSGGNANPTFALKKPIVLSNPNHYFVASVKSCDIPYSFKALSAPYNTLRVRYTEHEMDSTTVITISEGNYSISNLLKELKSRLMEFLDTVPHEHLPTLNFVYDNNSGKCTLNMEQVSGGNDTTLTLYWSDPNTDFLAEFFGFTGINDSILSYDATGEPNSVNSVSEINVNVSPITSIYIRSSSLSQPTTNTEFLVEYNNSISDILLKVPVNVPYGAWIMWSNTDFEIRLSNNIVDTISFYLTHLSFNTISLAGVHWRCQLYLKEIKPHDVAERERMEQDNQDKIQEMQSMKMQLIDELEGLKNSLVLPENETTDDLEQMKQDLLNQVRANRENNIAP